MGMQKLARLKKAMNQINTAIYLLEKRLLCYFRLPYLYVLIFILKNKPDKSTTNMQSKLETLQKILKKQISISNKNSCTRGLKWLYIIKILSIDSRV
jgi:hypothetical protein